MQKEGDQPGLSSTMFWKDIVIKWGLQQKVPGVISEPERLGSSEQHISGHTHIHARAHA